MHSNSLAFKIKLYRGEQKEKNTTTRDSIHSICNCILDLIYYIYFFCNIEKYRNVEINYFG